MPERLAREARKARGVLSGERNRWRAAATPRAVVATALRLAGLRRTARRNARALELTRHTLALPALPAPFAGFRLLHVSDPHFGADADIDAAIVARAGEPDHDLCVLSGDYRYRSFGPIDAALDGLGRLRERLDGRVLAVLGNHDSIEMVPAMEAMGIEVLLNESRTLRRDGAALHVAGVDDPRYYRLDDLARALRDRDVRADEPAATLLLAHSPEIAGAAAAADCDACLCGHTHGGQICLPGGTPLFRNAPAPRERLSGAWRLGNLHGYTSRGAGVSIVEARLFCPPEITLHTLARAARE